METKRLRTIQQPSHLERLLDAYITRSDAVPKDAYQIRDPSAAAPSLQALIAQAGTEARVWACWEHASGQWLFTAEMSLPLSRERGTPVLRVNRYDDRGRLIEAGDWMADPRGVWQRLAE